MSDYRVRTCVKIAWGCDLSETSIMEAFLLLQKEGDRPRALVTSSANTAVATDLAAKYRAPHYELPADLLGHDAWALQGETHVVWSAGA